MLISYKNWVSLDFNLKIIFFWGWSNSIFQVFQYYTGWFFGVLPKHTCFTENFCEASKICALFVRLDHFLKFQGVWHSKLQQIFVGVIMSSDPKNWRKRQTSNSRKDVQKVEIPKKGVIRIRCNLSWDLKKRTGCLKVWRMQTQQKSLHRVQLPCLIRWKANHHGME